MLTRDYEIHSKNLLVEASNIEGKKRPAYTVGNEDCLHNFKNVAQRMGITPQQAWGVYFLKHVDSICAFAKDPAIPQAEEMLGRYADAINYLKLGYSLYIESTQKKEGL